MVSTRRFQVVSLFILRLVSGVYFLNFGLSAIWTPGWSLMSFISGAQTFTAFYHGLAVSSFLPLVALVVKFGCLIIGLLLIAGILVRITSLVGITLMLFLYFPVLAFPYVCGGAAGVLCGSSSPYLVNNYLLIAAALLVLFTFNAGKRFSLGGMFHFF